MEPVFFKRKYDSQTYATLNNSISSIDEIFCMNCCEKGSTSEQTLRLIGFLT